MYRVAKRFVDLVVSIVAIFLTIPLAFIVALAIWKVDPEAPVIYRQKRVGRNGSEFWMLKFRTMYGDSDNLEKYFTPEQLKQWEIERKVDNDPRILPYVGHFLRKTSLDELPQFVNVLFGQLSVIGPRAVTKAELHHYGKDVDELLSIRPGVTGPWQVGDRNDATFTSGKRQAIDLGYVRKANPLTDTKVFFRTFSTMFFRRTGR